MMRVLYVYYETRAQFARFSCAASQCPRFDEYVAIFYSHPISLRSNEDHISLENCGFQPWNLAKWGLTLCLKLRLSKGESAPWFLRL
jgi:hypothetical protein